jgi:ATP-dependent Lon protease
VTDEVKDKLIQDYCRDAGMRDITKKMEQILEKVAVSVVKGESVEVNLDNLVDYAG